MVGDRGAGEGCAPGLDSAFRSADRSPAPEGRGHVVGAGGDSATRQLSGKGGKSVEGRWKVTEPEHGDTVRT